MRILHTSDWHLGRSFHRVGMLDAQAAVPRPPGRGRARPSGSTPSWSRVTSTTGRCRGSTWWRCSTRRWPGCAGTGAAVVLSSGNHDSPRRLGFGARLLERARVHVRTDPARSGSRSLLEDRYGAVAVYPLPYLEPALAGPALGCAPGAAHEAVLAAAMDARSAPTWRRGRAGTRSVVAAHAFVVGGEPSDSERDISVGGVGAVPAGVFAGVDYVALGHLHGRQRLARDASGTRGSPLAYSFSEARTPRARGWSSSGRARRRARRRGRRAGPAAAGRAARAPRRPAAPTRPSRRHEAAWCQVTLTDDERPAEAMTRVRARFPHALELRFDPRGRRGRRAYTAARARSRTTSRCAAASSSTCAAGARDAERELLRRRSRGRGCLARESGVAPLRAAAGWQRDRTAAAGAPPSRRRAGGRVRVHRLRVTAFGPFAGTAEVDLDALAPSGLFLLHGPTGAGKTSVLDAVCFALYGAVPGRSPGRPRLRSDHAAAGVAPEVVLRVTAGGRRLEVTRSPAWERPKRRGAGTTTEQARVLVRELRRRRLGAGRRAASTRRRCVLDDVLGLGLEQFTKLVLLPQGDFAAFLRADAESRRALLERLFGTDRFAGRAAVAARVRRRLARPGRRRRRRDRAAAGASPAGGAARGGRAARFRAGRRRGHRAGRGR